MKISLKKGWNLVSFNKVDLSVITSNKNIIEIKSGEKTWNRFVPNIFNTLIQLEITNGYMVLAKEDTELEFDISEVNKIVYKLIKGWNLIGWQKNIDFDNLQLDDKIEVIKDNSLSYDSSIPDIFNNLTEMKSGSAYWLKSSENFMWSINFSSYDVNIKFDKNLREFNVKVKSIGNNLSTTAKIFNKKFGFINLDNQIDFLPGNLNRKLEIKNDITSSIIIPNLNNNQEVEFIVKTFNLPIDNYDLNISNSTYQLIIPDIDNFDYTNSKYFINDNFPTSYKRPKMLKINFIGSDNDLERFAYLDLIEQAKFVQANKNNFNICLIALVDRSNYSSFNDDTKSWNESSTFNEPIDDRTFGIYICNESTNNKWSKFEIGNYKQVLTDIKEKYNNVSTKKEVLDLFLNLVFKNLLEIEINNFNVALLLNFWNHGLFYGISMDPKTVNKVLYMDKIYNSIKSVLDKYNIKKLDYLTFDCCSTASLSNIKLFSSISRYFLSASTIVPSFGNNYNYILPKETNIKNNYLDYLFKNTIDSYKNYLSTLSVFNCRKFLFFEDHLKFNLEKKLGIVDIDSKFSKLKIVDRNINKLKSLKLFLSEIQSNLEEYEKIYNLYDKSLVKSTRKENAVLISQENLYYQGEKLDRVSNVEYLYNFFKKQEKKGTVNIKFNSNKKENKIITTIKIEKIGKIEEDILLRFSNGFLIINSFNIVDSNSDTDIYKVENSSYLRIKNSELEEINISISTNNFIEVIYYNGLKFYQDISKFNNLFTIKGEDYHIESLSESLELSKANVDNITGNKYNKFGEFEITKNNNKYQITGNIFESNNLIVSYGTDKEIIHKGAIMRDVEFYGFISNNNNNMIVNKINMEIELFKIKINNYEFNYIDFFEDDNYIRVIIPVIYQEQYNQDVNYNSKLVNLELIRNKKDNIISKKLWNSYGTVTSEIYSENSYIYQIILTNYSVSLLADEINIFDKKYNYIIDNSKIIKFNEITDFSIVEWGDDLDTVINLNIGENVYSKIFPNYDLDFTNVNKNNLLESNKLSNNKTLILQSDILLTNTIIELTHDLIIPQDIYLIIGDNSKLIVNKRFKITNLGYLIVQDNGQLDNYGIIDNIYLGNLIITSGNKNKISKIDNYNDILFQILSKMYITGYSIVKNYKKLLFFDISKLLITSLNPSYQIDNNTFSISSKTYSKLFNYNFISIQLELEINYGGQLINYEGIVDSSIIKLLIYIDPESKKTYASKIIDNSKYCYTKEEIFELYKQITNSNEIQYNNENQIINENMKMNIYNLNRISLLRICNVLLVQKPVSFDNAIPNFNLNISEDSENLVLRINNDSDYNSFTEQIFIFTNIYSRNYKDEYYINQKLDDFTISNRKFVHKIYLNKQIIIEPPPTSNDYIELKINKYNIAKNINSFNDDIKITFVVNKLDLIKESNYLDNSLSYTFIVEE